MTRGLTQKSVLLQEFGVPTDPILRQEPATEELPKDFSLADEEAAARFAEESLGLARRFQMIGAFWGCYGDYHPIIWRVGRRSTEIRGGNSLACSGTTGAPKRM